MEKNMKKNWIEIVTIIVAIVLFFVPNYIAPIGAVHPGMPPMACYYSGALVMKLAGWIIVVCVLMLLFAKYTYGKCLKVIGSIIVIILAALVYMIPHRAITVLNAVGKPYGYCGKPTMACIINNTFGVAGIVGGIIIILMLINLIMLFLRKDR